jgi:hypothetical protein
MYDLVRTSSFYSSQLDSQEKRTNISKYIPTFLRGYLGCISMVVTIAEYFCTYHGGYSYWELVYLL